MKRGKKTVSLMLAAVMVLSSQMGMVAEAKPAKAADSDLAREAAIVADCPVHQSGKYDVKPINDGDDSTGWVSEAFTTGQHKKHWVYVDFGSPKTFDEVKLVWDNAKYAEDYKVQVSTTAREGDWHDRAVEKDNKNGGKKTYEMEATTARYVRIYSTKNAAKDETVQLNTFSVFKNKKDVADKDAVAKDIENLTEDYVKSATSLYEEIANKDLKNVKATLNIPKKGFASSDIEWSVSPNDGGINVDTGEVIRGEKDKAYELTATVTKGEVSETKTFDVMVKANKVLASQIVEMEDRTYLELDGSPFLYVTVQQCGTQQLLGDNAINGLSSFKETKNSRPGFTDLYGDEDEIPLAYLENMWEKMHDIGYKHMGIILKWRDWEPKNAGEYDWTVVDQYIEWCDKYDISWDIVYFGSNSCGGTRLTNGNVAKNQWWMRNVPEYLDKHDGYWHNGDYVGENHCPVLKGENYEYIKSNELRAIQALMNHLAEKDVNKRTATFQVMNEPDWHTRYNTEDKRWVQEWISDAAVAIKASDYSLVTRVNGGYGMPHEDYIPISKLPGVDMCGDDAYTTSISTIKDIFQKDLYDAGFPHIAENDGSFTNTSSLVLATLLYGGGYHGWQFNDQWWDQGMADTAVNGDYWKWQLGTPIKWRESGQDMSRLNPAMNKISDILACAPLKSMAGMNLETDNPAKNYQKVQMLDGIFAGYECNDASVAMAIKDGNDVYLVSDSASSGDGSVNFLSYQPLQSASYVGYYKDEVGVADPEWVEEQPIEVVQGEDGIYRVPVKAGEAIKVTFGESRLAAIQELTTSVGSLTPDFDANTHEYSMTVGADVSDISVNAVLSDENAQYSVNGKILASGVASQKVPLQFGETEIKVRIIWDGMVSDTEANVYTIKVHRSEMNFNGGTYENAALKKKISSPNYTGAWWHDIKGAVDGNINTLAQPAKPDPIWNAQIDLDGEYAVDRVKLVTGASNFPTKFNVNVSEDGEKWTTVLTQENFNGGVYDQSFAPQKASYIMLEVLEANTGKDCGWAPYEIEVYGVNGGSASELSAEQAAGSILSIPAYSGTGKLAYPKIPNGFTVTVERSSNEKIIALDGTVTPGKFDETVYLQFKVVNDADKKDAAFSKKLPIVIQAQGTTPQNINLALNKGITGTVSGTAADPLENVVDGNQATRYAASAAGYPNSVTVDLGGVMDINQVVTTWDASRPGKYQIWTSYDQQDWKDLGTYELDRDGTVVNDVESTACRYVKLEALQRGPNTNVFAIMELEIYNRMSMPENFVIEEITLSEGTISPAFDKNLTSYSAIVGGESITVTAKQKGSDAYVFVNGEKTISGTASAQIALEPGSNVITVSVQDPDNAANVVNYQLEVVRKEFSLDEYKNVILEKNVTTPGFEVGYWHPLKQINDGDVSTFAQSSSKDVLDYQFYLDGCFMVDEFEIYTGGNNRPTAFDVKTSLDGINWKTVLTVNSFNPAVTKYAFEPIFAKYILMDNKTSDGGWMAINEIVVNGIPKELSSQAVADMLGDMETASDESEILFTGIPEGYTVLIKESSNPDVITVEGAVTHMEKYEEVDLTLEVAKGADVVEKVIHVTVQPATLTNQAVLDKIVNTLSQSQGPEKDQTMMLLPEAPAGFNVTYRVDQDGSGQISIDGNVMTIHAGLSDFSLPLGIHVSGEAGGEAVDAWHTIYFKGRSQTAQEVLADVQADIDGTKVVFSGVPEGYNASVVASSNQYVIDAAGNVITPDTTTAVDVYAQVTKNSDQTKATKAFSFSVAGKVDKTPISEVIAMANERLNDGKSYTAETEAALREALETAEAYHADPTIPQSILDEAKEMLKKALNDLKEIIVDKTALTELYNQCKDMTEQESYTQATWDAFVAARDGALTVLNNGDVTQQQVNDAYTALLSARLNLEEKVNKELLISAIQLGEGIDTAGYTAETVQNLTDALAVGNAVLGDDAATEEQVSEAVQGIMKAIAGLEREEAPVQVNKDNLKKLADAASKLTEEKYTPVTWKVLEDALKTAKNVIGNDEAAQTEADKVFEELLNAMMNLENRGEKTGLKSVIDMAKAILKNKDQYEASSLNGLDKLVKDAEALYKDNNASQQAVNEMTEKLSKAILQAKPIAPDGENTGDSGNKGDGGDSDKNGSNKDDKKNATITSKTPRTGDSVPVAPWIAAALGALIIMSAATRKIKNKR